jgi:DNA-binding MarR family transcriptional regulator
MVMSQDGEKEYDIWVLLSIVYHLIAKLRRLELSKHNVLPVQAYILFLLHALGGEASPSEISRYAYEHKSAISDILIRMEKQGLITKSKNNAPGGRVKVKLTEKGEDALQLSSERAFLEKVMSGLTPEKIEQLESFLELMRDNAKNELDVRDKNFIPPSKVSKHHSKKELESIKTAG